MGYSKEQVVELFKEYDNTADGDGVRNSISYFLREKGLITPVLEVGKWYRQVNTGFLFCITSINECDGSFKLYGFNSSGSWVGSDGYSGEACKPYKFKEATYEEVETALIAEAKKRGFKEGVKFKALSPTCAHEDGIEGGLKFKSEYNVLTDFYSALIFDNGKWATTVNTELDELKATYKELGRKIDELENK